MNTRIEKIEYTQKNIVLGLGALLAILLALYAFYISIAIRNTIVREKLASDTSALHASVGSSEQEYVALKESVTADLATSLGFVPSPELTFVSMAPQGKIFSFNIR